MSVDIEFVGDPPMLDETMQLRIATGQVPPSAARVLRSAQASLTTAIKGIDKRVIDPEYFGTSRTYVFGPFCFVVAVEDHDVDKILGSSSGHQFRIVGEEGVQIIRPPANIQLVSEIEGGKGDFVWQK